MDVLADEPVMSGPRAGELMSMSLALAVALAVGVSDAAGESRRQQHITPAQRAVVDAFVKAHLPEDAEEPSASREYIVGVAAADSPAVLVALYTVEEGNNWTQFMVAFKLDTLAYLGHSQVGGKGLRSVELTSASGSVIETTTLYYSDYDALCCPTVPGHSAFDAFEGGLAEEEARVSCDRWEAPTRARRRR
jgi:hypothetical protein